MGLKVVKASTEDAARSIDIEKSAFSADPLTPALFPGPFTDGDEQRINERVRMLNDSPYTQLYKVVDEDLEAQGKESAIAIALWYVWDTQPVSNETWPPKRQLGPGVNVEAMEAFLGGMKERLIERYTGKNLVCEYELVVSCK